tara:strand:- start:4491 stop:4814 length:324 start_codon:yes stop_codon:yes gene_type:complete
MYHFDKKIQYQNDEEYQSQFLSLFGLEKYDNDVVEKGLDDLVNLVKQNTSLKESLEKLSEKYLLTKNLDMGLTLGMSYDYLDIVHPMLTDMYYKKKINSQPLINKIS